MANENVTPENLCGAILIGVTRALEDHFVIPDLEWEISKARARCWWWRLFPFRWARRRQIDALKHERTMLKKLNAIYHNRTTK